MSDGDTVQLHRMIADLSDRVLQLELQLSVLMIQHREHRHERMSKGILTSLPVSPEEAFSDGSPIPEEPHDE